MSEWKSVAVADVRAVLEDLAGGRLSVRDETILERLMALPSAAPCKSPKRMPVEDADQVGQ